MSETAELPQWLVEAVAEYRRLPDPEPVEAPVQAGDIRMVEGGGRAGFVLVHSVVQSTHSYFHTGTHETMEEPSFDWVKVTYLSWDIDLVADNTAVLTPEMTGLPFKLLATGLYGYPFASQLSGRYGSIPADLADGLYNLPVGNFEVFHRYPNLKRGMPLSGPSDWRWDEIANMLDEWQPLAGDALCAMMADLDGDPHPDGCPCSVCAKV